MKNFLTAMGPFFINTIAGMVITLPASVDLFIFRDFGGANILNYILGWLGVFIMMHAFPSTGDAKSMVTSILENPDVSLLPKLISAPFIGLIYLGAWGSVFWLDLFYALAMAAVLPNILAA